MFKKIIPIMFSSFLLSQSYAVDLPKFGVNFYDEANFLASDKTHTPHNMQQVPRVAANNFNLLRTITDFNEGDPSQFVCSCYQIGENIFNKRNCGFQKGVVEQDDLNVILTIENPEKWLSNKERAVAYVYQYILPLMRESTLPNSPELSPNFWGIKPNDLSQAGCEIAAQKNHIVAVVVGLEVGTHINPNSYNFEHKAKQVSNLNLYVQNLIDALNEFELKDQIYVTTSIAPSNCDEVLNNCSGILELLPLRNGQYVLNKQSYTINNVSLNFNNTFEALQLIQNQEYKGERLGVLLSLYHYWQYFPDIDLAQYATQDWEIALNERYTFITQTIKNEISNLPVSVGEIGWPTSGSNQCDGSPNTPSLETHQKLIEATYNWANQSAEIPTVLFWRLFQIDSDTAQLLNCNQNNPEFHYGLLNGELESLSSITQPQFKTGLNINFIENISEQDDQEDDIQSNDENQDQSEVTEQDEEANENTPNSESEVIMKCPTSKPNSNIAWLMDESNEPIQNRGYAYMLIQVNENNIPSNAIYSALGSSSAISGSSGSSVYPQLLCRYKNTDTTSSYYMSAGYYANNACQPIENGGFSRKLCQLQAW